MKCFDFKTTKIYIYHGIKGGPSQGMQGEGLVAVRCLIDSHRNAFRERDFYFAFFIFVACLLMCNDNNVIRLQYPKMEHKSKCSWISRGPSLSLCPPHGHTVWRRRRLQCHLKKKKKKISPKTERANSNWQHPTRLRVGQIANYISNMANRISSNCCEWVNKSMGKLKLINQSKLGSRKNLKKVLREEELWNL